MKNGEFIKAETTVKNAEELAKKILEKSKQEQKRLEILSGVKDE